MQAEHAERNDSFVILLKESFEIMSFGGRGGRSSGGRGPPSGGRGAGRGGFGGGRGGAGRGRGNFDDGPPSEVVGKNSSIFALNIQPF